MVNSTASRKTFPELPLSKEELAHIEDERARILGIRKIKLAPQISSLSLHSASAGSSGNSTSNEPPVAAAFVTSTEIYGSHIKKLMSAAEKGQPLGYDTDSDIDFMIAMRTLDAVESVLAPRLITCAQLCVLLLNFPNGKGVLNEHATFRVELIVRLYSILTDLVNFDIVLRELSNKEIAMLIFRLGLLNIWNPIKVR